MRKNISQPAGRQGFTIVELLLYTGILTIFLSVLTGIFTAILDIQLESESASALTTDSRFIFSRLAYDLGRASAIVTPSVLGQQTSNLDLQIGSTQLTYAVIGGNLIVSDATTSGALNGFGTTVSNISFRRYGNENGKHSVRILFSLVGRIERPFGTESRDFEATIGLR